MRILWLVAAGSLLQLLPHSALAAGGGSSLLEARRLMATGQAAEAEQLLVGELLTYAGDPDFDMLLGKALYRAGKPEQAYFAFERVTMVRPDDVEARLMLARISAERGDRTSADEQLQQLKQLPLSAKQKKAVAEIRATKASISNGRLFYQGYLEGGIGWDTNVTSGPDRRYLVIPAISLTPTDIDDAAQDADATGLLEAKLSARYRIGDDLWLTGGGRVRQDAYDNRNDYRDGFRDVYAGLLGQAGNNLFIITASGQDYRVGGVAYRRTKGGRLTLVHPIDNYSHATGYFQYSDYTYPAYPVDDAVRQVAGIIYARQPASPSAGWTVQLGADGGQEVVKKPDHKDLGFRLWGVEAGVSRAIGPDFTVSAGVIYESRHYNAADMLYEKVRKEQQWSAGLAADYQFAPSWHLLPGISYIRNDSNTKLYDYKRAIYTLIVRWDFSNE